MNEYLNQFKGKTINERITKDCSNYLLEEKLRITQKNPNEVSLVTVSDPKTKEIISMGGSTPSDLILDAFGFLWQEHIRIPVGGSVVTPSIFKAEDGVTRAFRIIDPLTAYNKPLGTRGGQIKIGQGSTAPARSDFDIETPFVTSPESLAQNVTAPFYDNILFQIQFFSSLQAGGSGSISEIGFFCFWRDVTTGGTRRYMLAHDLISPGQAFVASQIITMNWTWQI